MRLQITTDYAIRIIIYLSKNGPELVTAKRISQDLGITYNYFNKVATRIRQAGFIETIQGPNGGYHLVKNPADITLYDIVETMEGPIIVNRCLEKDGFCSRRNGRPSDCTVHPILCILQEEIVDKLKSVTFAQL